MPNALGIKNLTASNLGHFYGSESYAWHFSKRIVLTDGAQYINNNGAAWFLDIIASYQSAELHKKARGLQFWKLRKLEGEKDFMAVVTCDDGDGRILVEQKIPFTDFPFNQLPDGLSFYVEHGSLDGKTGCQICMLTSER